MPVEVSYPGLYLEELPSESRPVTAASTSVTAFIGGAPRGPVDEPREVNSFGEFSRLFGGLWEHSLLGYSVQQFFLNGGSRAVIVRATRGSPAEYTLPGTPGPVTLRAANPGDWGNHLQFVVDHATRDEQDTTLFNLHVAESKDGRIVARESHLNLSTQADAPRYAGRVLKRSSLVRLTVDTDIHRPDASGIQDGAPTPVGQRTTDGLDGVPIDTAQVFDPALEGARRGLWALESQRELNLLVVPPYARDVDLSPSDRDQAAAYCTKRLAFYVADPSWSWSTPDAALGGLGGFMTRSPNAALFYPMVTQLDPLMDGEERSFPVAGLVAGIFARTDAERGVWKAPAGTAATLRGTTGLSYELTNAENGRLNKLGVNCLRSFPVINRVSWGGRTLVGADQLTSQWKYTPVRRTALFIEQSLMNSLQWVVFEPNDEALWSQIRLNVGAFMQVLFRKGAFQGTSPRQAYLVKCDAETTSQADIDNGIVNILVGFRPLKPAEFVVLQIQQLAGQA